MSWRFSTEIQHPRGERSKYSVMIAFTVIAVVLVASDGGSNISSRGSRGSSKTITATSTTTGNTTDILRKTVRKLFVTSTMWKFQKMPIQEIWQSPSVRSVPIEAGLHSSTGSSEPAPENANKNGGSVGEAIFTCPFVAEN